VQHLPRSPQPTCRPADSADHAGGFTLLEVMVAIAILGLSLTVILSAQGGLAASNRTANNVGTAINLGRCKMTELEEKLLKFGYPLIDDLQSDVNCCNDEEVLGYKCDTRSEKVLLPNPPSANTGDGGLSLSSPIGGMDGGLPTGLPGGLGGLGSGLGGGTSGGLDLDGGSLASLNFDGGLGSLGSTLQQQMGPMSGGAGTAGLLSMVMGIVYPSLKPMMEMSIRRLTVTIRWKEGPNKRDLTMVQYVTNPNNGLFAAGAPSASASASPGGASSSSAPSTVAPTPGGANIPTLPPGAGTLR
jgi:general secretion pathway protein I